tara:strand:- start:330 stop:506 length:177 start_codon:yes stop_codon:yes gene_type:complete
MTKKLTLDEIEGKIEEIESAYYLFSKLHLNLDRDKFHPHDRSNLIKYYRLWDKRQENA